MRHSVLVIHSDQPLRELARQILERAGHAVADAAVLLAGQRVARSVVPDLLLLQWTGQRLLREAIDRLRDSPATSQSRVLVWAGISGTRSSSPSGRQQRRDRGESQQ